MKNLIKLLFLTISMIITNVQAVIVYRSDLQNIQLGREVPEFISLFGALDLKENNTDQLDMISRIVENIKAQASNKLYFIIDNHPMFQDLISYLDANYSDRFIVVDNLERAIKDNFNTLFNMARNYVIFTELSRIDALKEALIKVTVQIKNKKVSRSYTYDRYIQYDSCPIYMKTSKKPILEFTDIYSKIESLLITPIGKFGFEYCLYSLSQPTQNTWPQTHKKHHKEDDEIKEDDPRLVEAFEEYDVLKKMQKLRQRYPEKGRSELKRLASSAQKTKKCSCVIL